MNKERSFTMIGPGPVKRGDIGKIITRLELAGLTLVLMKKILASRAQLELHYQKDNDWYEKKGERAIRERLADKLPIEKTAIEYGRDIIEGKIGHMLSGPIIIMVWEGENAIEGILELSEGIRRDFGMDIVDNGFHRSDSVDNADLEIKLWGPWF